MAPDGLFCLRGKRVWVAGGSGLVGAACTRRLAQEEDCEILTVSHADLDLTRQQDVRDWVAANRPDAIILAAARVGGIYANSIYPADFLYDNLAIATNVIHAAYAENVARLLYLGSSCVYPRLAPQPIRPESLFDGPLEETNQWYALAKIAGVKLCQAYRAQHGCHFIAAMPANLYGPGDRFDLQDSHVIPALILKMHMARLSGAPAIDVWGSGQALREFLYVEDLAEALILLLKKYDGGAPVNIGSGQEVTIADLAMFVQAVTGYEGRLVYNNTDKPEGVPRKVLDSAVIQAMGWHPRTSLEEGLEATYRWFLSTCCDGLEPGVARPEAKARSGAASKR